MKKIHIKQRASLENCTFQNKVCITEVWWRASKWPPRLKLWKSESQRSFAPHLWATYIACTPLEALFWWRTLLFWNKFPSPPREIQFGKETKESWLRKLMEAATSASNSGEHSHSIPDTWKKLRWQYRIDSLLSIHCATLVAPTA